MQIIGKQVLKSFRASGDLVARSSFAVRRYKPCMVRSYLDLATRVATLQFENPEYVLLFRGQRKEYTRVTSGGVKFTSLHPGMFRRERGLRPSRTVLAKRYQRLELAERALVAEYELAAFPNIERLQRQQILRWSIIQHYEICDTPLLDVTHSLRVAASFASASAIDEAFVYVIGVPNLSGAITASANDGIQIVRLASVCPPQAMRPHIQEGYLLGEYPELRQVDAKAQFTSAEVDFGRRLVAKFQFHPNRFWAKKDEFPKVEEAALYPNRDDPVYKLAQRVKAALPRAN